MYSLSSTLGFVTDQLSSVHSSFMKTKSLPHASTSTVSILPSVSRTFAALSPTLMSTNIPSGTTNTMKLLLLCHCYHNYHVTLSYYYLLPFYYFVYTCSCSCHRIIRGTSTCGINCLDQCSSCSHYNRSWVILLHFLLLEKVSQSCTTTLSGCMLFGI